MEKEEQFSHRVMLGEQGEIAIPTVEFNIIFQLTHIYAHLMNEGIGLRQLLDYYFVICDFYKVYQNSSKITPSLFFDKASCTRQFESELSLHSLASLFPLKEGSTSHPDPLQWSLHPLRFPRLRGTETSGAREKTALLGARNRYALRLAGHQSPRHILRDRTAWLLRWEI